MTADANATSSPTESCDGVSARKTSENRRTDRNGEIEVGVGPLQRRRREGRFLDEIDAVDHEERRDRSRDDAHGDRMVCASASRTERCAARVSMTICSRAPRDHRGAEEHEPDEGELRHLFGPAQRVVENVAAEDLEQRDRVPSRQAWTPRLPRRQCRAPRQCERSSPCWCPERRPRQRLQNSCFIPHDCRGRMGPRTCHPDLKRCCPARGSCRSSPWSPGSSRRTRRTARLSPRAISACR